MTRERRSELLEAMMQERLETAVRTKRVMLEFSDLLVREYATLADDELLRLAKLNVAYTPGPYPELEDPNLAAMMRLIALISQLDEEPCKAPMRQAVAATKGRSPDALARVLLRLKNTSQHLDVLVLSEVPFEKGRLFTAVDPKRQKIFLIREDDKLVLVDGAELIDGAELEFVRQRRDVPAKTLMAGFHADFDLMGGTDGV